MVSHPEHCEIYDECVVPTVFPPFPKSDAERTVSKVCFDRFLLAS
jgi:hypothetical protein